MFIYRQGTDFLIVQIYVEDIIFGGTSSDYVEKFVAQMKGEFEMSMVGELTFFQGFQIKQEKIGIFFSQEKYAKNLISKFGMDKAKPKRTPAATHLKMTKDSIGEKVDTNLYRSIIGSLLYLTASRPDIAFVVGVCARYQADPPEAEYITAGSGCSQLLWMKQMLDEYGITQSSMILYCDNLSAISISKNPLAGVFTKPLDVATFEGLRASYRVCQRPSIGIRLCRFSDALPILMPLIHHGYHSIQEIFIWSARPSVSSSVPKSSSRPERRVSVETVVLDSDSSDSENNMVLSTILHRMRSVRSNQTACPAKPQSSGGVSPKVASP
ncbi:putative mitochondrial protein [Cucumis melo var. makuwa]|uniref:Mitochondrial protein n=1 Tax=Cucumis melo var. makuwa TaxID=1194695 RepID=A0A5D3D1I3_CUCMM|nr:putative mitochondrial protein [Cucumis melo var. makuwa]TYK17084.1 putative mitochondrial protein [Cucumis melo var. makuwa]